MQIRPAHSDEIDLITRWRRDAAEWIADRGHDQWSTAGLDDDGFRHRVAESISAGETWMALDGETPVGTIAIDDQADPGLWSTDEQASAVIAHRMIVPRCASGRGVGAVLLAQADQVAEARQRMYVRLDAWTSNTDLHDYYRRAGFRHVRTLIGHDTPSAALFERRVWSVPRPPFPKLAGRCDP